MKYQAHIDGLRAIAVIAVVMFHAFPNITSGGYIGVDIFFVISGYLITSIILADLDSGRFTLSEFYFRRIRRIFPALITVLIACFVFGWFYLLADEFSLLGKHIAGGATFVSNLLLWQEVGYFDVQSESKPLLHLWSLAIEEQFYLIWPWLVIFGMRLRRLKTVVLIFTIASLILNLICVWYFPSATFYLPLTRFWELGIGGALALYATELQELGFAKKRILATLGVILVIASMFIFKGNWTFPGFWALIPVLGSALVLLYAQSFRSLYFALSNRVLVAIGLISFPLYLWHWPLLTFYHLLDPDHNSLVISLLVLFSFGLAALTFQYIEKPLRIRSAKKSAGYLLLLMGLIFLLGMYTVARDGFAFRKYSQYDTDMRWHSWAEKACQKQYGIEPCQEQLGAEAIFLLGDSHANHLYPGLDQLWRGGVVNIGSCIPINPDSILSDPDFSKIVDRNNCFTKHIFTKQLEIIKAQNPKYVVISVAWNLYFDNANLIEFSTVDIRRYQKIQKELLISIANIQAMGATVVLVENVPRNEKLPKDFCGLRQRPEPQSCPIKYDQFAKGVSWQMLGELKEKNPEIMLVKTQDLFCQQEECQLIQDGQLLYRDEWHLSYSGSRLVGKKIIETLMQAQ